MPFLLKNEHYLAIFCGMCFALSTKDIHGTITVAGSAQSSTWAKKCIVKQSPPSKRGYSGTVKLIIVSQDSLADLMQWWTFLQFTKYFLKILKINFTHKEHPVKWKIPDFDSGFQPSDKWTVVNIKSLTFYVRENQSIAFFPPRCKGAVLAMTATHKKGCIQFVCFLHYWLHPFDYYSLESSYIF